MDDDGSPSGAVGRADRAHTRVVAPALVPPELRLGAGARPPPGPSSRPPRARATARLRQEARRMPNPRGQTGGQEKPAAD